MKKSIIILVQAVFLLFSCTSREEKETKSLLLFLLERNFLTWEWRDTILVSEDSFTAWQDLSLFDTCTLEGFKRMQKASEYIAVNKKEIESILSESDVQKICNEGIASHKFDSGLFPPRNIELRSMDSLDDMSNKFLDNFYLPDGTIDPEVYSRGHPSYIMFSKPVFLYNYRYAFIYSSKIEAYSDSNSFLVLEKKGDTWEIMAEMAMSPLY